MITTTTSPSWVSVQQAANLAAVHHFTIRRAVWSGALPASRIGKVIRIAPQDLEAWLRAKPAAKPASTST